MKGDDCMKKVHVTVKVYGTLTVKVKPPVRR